MRLKQSKKLHLHEVPNQDYLKYMTDEFYKAFYKILYARLIDDKNRHLFTEGFDSILGIGNVYFLSFSRSENAKNAGIWELYRQVNAYHSELIKSIKVRENTDMNSILVILLEHAVDAFTKDFYKE